MQEFTQITKWLIFCATISFCMRPYLRIQKYKLADAGFAASFALGLALTFFTSWILSALHIIPYDEFCYIPTVVMCLAPIIIYVIKIRKAQHTWIDAYKIIKMKIKNDASEHLIPFLYGFICFAAIFIFIVWVRGFQPGINSTTEQYMDFGFLNAFYKQHAAVPEDIWFSGHKLNYYFLGQACTAYICRMAGVAPEYGYHFMLATIFAGVACMSFSLVAGIVDHFAKEKRKTAAVMGGIIATLATCFAGNGHYLVYGLIAPVIEKIAGSNVLKYNETGYFFPESTIFIGNYPETLDKGKNEFLAYSVILGDLHAHMINLLFVLPLLVIVIDYALDNKPQIRLKEWLLDPRYLLISILLAIFAGTNFWDFPIYFVVSGALILFHDLFLYKKSVYKKPVYEVLTEVLIKGILIFAATKLFAWPFEANFAQISTQIGICDNHTPLYKMAILWGIPVVICAGFAIYVVITKKINLSTLVFIALAACATGLVIVPEIIYVKDIYGVEYARFNTMFKLTYQAFLLFGLCMGIAVGIWLSKKRVVEALITTIMVQLLSGYLITATYQWMGNIFNTENRQSTNIYEAAIRNPDLYEAMTVKNILDQDSRENIHILEASGLSYTECCQISAMTGACTYIGWPTHEWLWQGSWKAVQDRQEEVRKFYEDGDIDFCKNFVKENDMDYIIVGPTERETYQVNEENYNQLGMNISTDEMMHIYRIYEPTPPTRETKK